MPFRGRLASRGQSAADRRSVAVRLYILVVTAVHSTAAARLFAAAFVGRRPETLWHRGHFHTRGDRDVILLQFPYLCQLIFAAIL